VRNTKAPPAPKANTHITHHESEKRIPQRRKAPKEAEAIPKGTLILTLLALTWYPYMCGWVVPLKRSFFEESTALQARRPVAHKSMRCNGKLLEAFKAFTSLSRPPGKELNEKKSETHTHTVVIKDEKYKSLKLSKLSLL